MTGFFATSHPCWLAPVNARPLLRRDVVVLGGGVCARTARDEVRTLRDVTGAQPERGAGRVLLGEATDLAAHDDATARVVAAALADAPEGTVATAAGPDGAVVGTAGERGLVHALWRTALGGEAALASHDVHVDAPAAPVRMLDHWDNLAADSPMGSVERGYAGDSIFWRDGRLTDDLGRVRDYARLLASLGVDAVSVNNVNVHAREARLLTDRLDDVAALADVFRGYGVATYLSVSFAAPVELGGLPTADPLDPAVVAWWREATDRVYARVPDFGGYVVKADSENRPGPFTYGRDHVDGANLLADALEPHGGTVFWRCFVYDHRQDWRDRSTDRARAAYDHFVPLDGRFADNVVLQVKNGPIDFQVREPVSPLLGALERTNVALELQVTQEYTGQQKHVCYLGPQWREVLDFPIRGEGEHAAVRDVVSGRATGRSLTGTVGVSNVGDDPTWTGHPFAQANLYAFGRLAWDPQADPDEVLREWAHLTFPGSPVLADGVVDLCRGSWLTYERYTAPLGVGFMVNPGHHYGPNVDGYEYTPWGTYHFADRDGIGVDRTVRTGTGYTAQYREPWASRYEDLATCPDELLLFFHHVPWDHVLHDGRTVVQHVYDTRFQGVEEVEAMAERWAGLAPLAPPDVAREVTWRLEEQLRCAREWRDQVCTYVLRKSGVPDARGRTIHP